MTKAQIGLNKWYKFLNSRGKTHKTLTLNDIIVWEEQSSWRYK